MASEPEMLAVFCVKITVACTVGLFSPSGICHAAEPENRKVVLLVSKLMCRLEIVRAGALVTEGATWDTSLAKLIAVFGNCVASKVKFSFEAASVKVREAW